MNRVAKNDVGRSWLPGSYANASGRAWAIARCAGPAEAQESRRDLVRAPDGIDAEGFDVCDAEMANSPPIDPGEVRAQLPQVRQHLATFGERLPRELRGQLEALEERLGG